jgi:hypothetical protein
MTRKKTRQSSANSHREHPSATSKDRDTRSRSPSLFKQPSKRRNTVNSAYDEILRSALEDSAAEAGTTVVDPSTLTNGHAEGDEEHETGGKRRRKDDDGDDGYVLSMPFLCPLSHSLSSSRPDSKKRTRSASAHSEHAPDVQYAGREESPASVINLAPPPPPRAKGGRTKRGGGRKANTVIHVTAVATASVTVDAEGADIEGLSFLHFTHPIHCLYETPHLLIKTRLLLLSRDL